MKTLPFYVLFICLFFSCSKNELSTNEDSSEEIIDESIFHFHEGFTDRKPNTNIKTILPSDKSILLTEFATEENELVKFNIPSLSNNWQAETWYRERAGTGSHNYHHENVILFRHGHHDFAINLEDGTLLYDVEREGCPDTRLTGIDYQYFTRSTVTDEATQLTKQIVLIGDIRKPDTPEFLVSPHYDSIGNNGSLGRIMGLHAFENEVGEHLLAIRYFDYESDYPLFKDLFAVYNITQSSWLVAQVPLEYHITGAQTVVANGLIYYGSQSHVSCLDVKTGELKWVTEANTLAPTKLLAFADGDIFVRDYNGMLQRRRAETGELMWETYLGNIQRFIIIHDKLFSIGKEFTITSIETGETIHAFSSPYIDYDPAYYFDRTKDLMGYYDEAIKRSYIFLNSDDQMICYEIAD